MNKITHVLFPQLIKQEQQLLTLQNELQQTIKQCQQETVFKKSLLQEIEYLYSVLVHNNGYRYRLLVLPNVPPLLCTVGIRHDRTVLVLYMPSDNKEIAHLSLHHAGNTMIIESVVINPMVYGSKQISDLLIQQVVIEAHNLKMQQIIDSSGQTVIPIQKEASRLGELLGIHIATAV